MQFKPGEEIILHGKKVIPIVSHACVKGVTCTFFGAHECAKTMCGSYMFLTPHDYVAYLAKQLVT